MREHSFSSCAPNSRGVRATIDFSNDAELLIHFNNWSRLLLVGVESFSNSFDGVVGAAGCFCTFHAAGFTNFFGGVEEENVLGFTAHLFEVGGLLFFTREAVD